MIDAAEHCRERGWKVDDELEGDEGYGVSRIRITAIGERAILAKMVAHKGFPVDSWEGTWTLAHRDWKLATASVSDEKATTWTAEERAETTEQKQRDNADAYEKGPDGKPLLVTFPRSSEAGPNATGLPCTCIESPGNVHEWWCKAVLTPTRTNEASLVRFSPCTIARLTDEDHTCDTCEPPTVLLDALCEALGWSRVPAEDALAEVRIRRMPRPDKAQKHTCGGRIDSDSEDDCKGCIEARK